MTRNLTSEPITAGLLVHRGICELLQLGRVPTAIEIDRLVVSMTPTAALPNVNDRAFRQRIGAGIRSYFWRFALGPPWYVVTTEMAMGDSRIDVVWSDGYRYLFDEVKSGLVTQLAIDGSGGRQTDRYARLGRDHLGERFAGVRCLTLLDPTRAVLKSAPGVGQPIPAELLAEAA